MATTARPIEILVNGVRDTTGAVVASAKVRWYNPGTLVAATAYTDAACATPATAPVTCNAAGQTSLYVKSPVRLIIKDSTETTTYYDDIPSLNRAESVYITNTNFNSGAETTLDALLTTSASSLGTDFKYKESSGATARLYTSWIGELAVSVKDFGAVGDGATDDTTAIQAAYDRVKARGGGWVYWPIGTYKITAAITIDTASVNTMGAGRAAIIKNFGTTTNAFTVNLGSSTDSKMTFRDVAITANTTSSGAGISFTNGNSPELINVSVALHRTGIATASVIGASLRDIIIASTDDNAAGVGVSLGTRGRIFSSEITCGTSNGTGINCASTDARVTDCYVTKFATGISLGGTNCQVKGGQVSTAGTTGISSSSANVLVTGPEVINAGTTGISLSGVESMVRDAVVDTTVTGVSLTGARSVCMGSTVLTATTGISLGAARTVANFNVVRASTTGIAVGAFASCVVVGNSVSGNTTDLSVNASATLLEEHGNAFSTLSDSATTPHSWMSNRAKVAKVSKVTDNTGNPSITPTPQSCEIYVAYLTAATGTITLNATSTTGLVDGQEFTVVIQRNGGSGALTPSINSQYDLGGTSIGTVSSGQFVVLDFIWRAAGSTWASRRGVTAISALSGTNVW